MSASAETLARVARLIQARSVTRRPGNSRTPWAEVGAPFGIESWLSDADLESRILDALAEKRLMPIVEHDGTGWVAEVKIEDRRIPRYRPARLSALLAVIDELPEDAL